MTCPATKFDAFEQYKGHENQPKQVAILSFFFKKNVDTTTKQTWVIENVHVEQTQARNQKY